MKTKKIALIGGGIGLVLALSAGTVMASGWGWHGHHGNGHAERMEEMVRAIDSNLDGAISTEEANDFRDARFKAMDANADGEVTPGEFEDGIRAWHFDRLDGNADGMLSRDEYVAAQHHGGTRHIMRRFHHLDDNENGRIDNAEMSEMAGHLFSRLDDNADGLIDASELDRVRDRMHR